jgi:hypothetical protein
MPPTFVRAITPSFCDFRNPRYELQHRTLNR